MDRDDQAFAEHVKNVLNIQFYAMNTDIHLLVLFLHSLCQKLVDAYWIALDIVQHWNWTKEMAKNLISDLKAYHNGDAPFNRRKLDAKVW